MVLCEAYNAFDWEWVIRIILATIVGAMLGFERERHGRAAGLRTTILVCLSSCVAMILSESFYISSVYDAKVAAILSSAGRPDPMRLAAGVISGMGFLGAGVIIRQSGYIVRGVTTAATLWCACIIGIAIGCGELLLGVVATLVVFVILCILPFFEAHIKDDCYSAVTVDFDKAFVSVQDLLRKIEEHDVKVNGLDYRVVTDGKRCEAVFRVKYKRPDMLKHSAAIPDSIMTLSGVHNAHWHE